MTKREYFDLLVSTSLNGGFPSVMEDDNAGSFCAYRSHDGKKCAAGLLIPDEKYDPSMEGNLAHNDSMRKCILVPEGMTFVDIRMCQELHDFLSNDWWHEEFVRRLLSIECFREFADAV